MKQLIIFVCSCSLMLVGCSTEKEVATFQKIEYKAITRGYSKQIVIQKDSLRYFENNRETRSLIITKKIKNTLNGFLEKLNLTSLHQLKSTSEKHQYDGAMYTTIEVIWDNKTYKSVGFDDDNPPKELIPFLHYLVALVK
ncbi:hypothetical protein N9K11_00740 [bacterium]|nr:hypothetical protein [Flavobacteriaceae bacterium]MDA9073528.1 hypothetical protein [bacterium]MDA9328153.1 hypothetical protein [Flavobacteriaceae bacterium]MDA9353608.1 hypothetical protein [Flavobacteriaceae bacterium]MDB0061374.1 hypothetical protein [bacterium]